VSYVSSSFCGDVPLVPSKTGGRPSGIYTTLTNEDLEVTEANITVVTFQGIGYCALLIHHPLGIHWEISILKICWWQYRVFSERRLS